MNLERYECTADSQFSSFTFDSIGPNRTIRKVINYEQIPGIFLPDGSAVRNLAFGDWNEVEERIDDGIVSNNNDRDKVLATVASTIISFTESMEKYLSMQRAVLRRKRDCIKWGSMPAWIQLNHCFGFMAALKENGKYLNQGLILRHFW